jgi:hypothetical protein
LLATYLSGAEKKELSHDSHIILSYSATLQTWIIFVKAKFIFSENLSNSHASIPDSPSISNLKRFKDSKFQVSSQLKDFFNIPKAKFVYSESFHSNFHLNSGCFSTKEAILESILKMLLV